MGLCHQPLSFLEHLQQQGQLPLWNLNLGSKTWGTSYYTFYGQALKKSTGFLEEHHEVLAERFLQPSCNAQVLLIRAWDPDTLQLLENENIPAQGNLMAQVGGLGKNPAVATYRDMFLHIWQNHITRMIYLYIHLFVSLWANPLDALAKDIYTFFICMHMYI